jgi:hypothetical protein
MHQLRFPSLRRFKIRWWPHDAVILHDAQIKMAEAALLISTASRMRSNAVICPSLTLTESSPNTALLRSRARIRQRLRGGGERSHRATAAKESSWSDSTSPLQRRREATPRSAYGPTLLVGSPITTHSPTGAAISTCRSGARTGTDFQRQGLARHVCDPCAS